MPVVEGGSTIVEGGRVGGREISSPDGVAISRDIANYGYDVDF